MLSENPEQAALGNSLGLNKPITEECFQTASSHPPVTTVTPAGKLLAPSTWPERQATLQSRKLIPVRSDLCLIGGNNREDIKNLIELRNKAVQADE